MNQIDLRRVDLNLLKSFDALERDRSVTAAAARLGVGQPAMSHALRRLRDLMEDPLFVRGPGGMVPTARATALIGPIRDALAQIEVALSGQTSFELLTSTRRFRVGMSDLVAAAVTPRLISAIRSRTPELNIAILNADRTNAARMLDDREIDLAIGLFPAVSGWHQKEDLFDEGFACVFRPDLVSSRRPISLTQYLKHPHILTTLQGDEIGFVDEILANQGRKRRILVTSPFFLLTGYLLHELPLIATLPRHYAELCVVTSQLALSPLPFATPSFTISMVWHRRDSSETASIFMRSLIVETTKRS